MRERETGRERGREKKAGRERERERRRAGLMIIVAPHVEDMALRIVGEVVEEDSKMCVGQGLVEGEGGGTVAVKGDGRNESLRWRKEKKGERCGERICVDWKERAGRGGRARGERRDQRSFSYLIHVGGKDG